MSEDKQAELVAQPCVMKAQIQIIRAGTGKVENYTITGHVPADTMQVIELPENEDGSHA